MKRDAPDIAALKRIAVVVAELEAIATALEQSLSRMEARMRIEHRP